MEYLAALGVNVVQPLPVYEMEDSPSQGYPGLGYQGSDLYSPEFDYVVYDAATWRAIWQRSTVCWRQRASRP